MQQFIAPVISNNAVGDGVYELTFEWGGRISEPLPGQFCTIQVSQTTAPLLRRPFAFSGFDRGGARASVVYQKQGPATEILSAKTPGTPIDIIGPLGNSFTDYEPGPANILVAGGTGFGPVLFLQRYFLARNKETFALFGFKTSRQAPHGGGTAARSTIICTEDGSEGFRGTTVDYLQSISDSLPENAVMFCCGPTPMLNACYEFAEKRGFDCYVAMEQIMACGVGACMGCAVRVHGNAGFARVCTEGPVFNGKALVWT